LKLYDSITAILGNHIILQARLSAAVQHNALLVLQDLIIDNLRLGTRRDPNANASLLKAVASHLRRRLTRNGHPHHAVLSELVALNYRGTLASYVHAPIAAAHKAVLANYRATGFNHQSIARRASIRNRHMAQSGTICSYHRSVE
jgi:hypothetical protein